MNIPVRFVGMLYYSGETYKSSVASKLVLISPKAKAA
jgi:hypothetical protein